MKNDELLVRVAQVIALTAFIAGIWLLIRENGTGKPISLIGIGGVVVGLGYLMKSLYFDKKK
jgi:hypothetical protein